MIPGSGVLGRLGANARCRGRSVSRWATTGVGGTVPTVHCTMYLLLSLVVQIVHAAGRALKCACPDAQPPKRSAAQYPWPSQCKVGARWRRRSPQHLRRSPCSTSPSPNRRPAPSIQPSSPRRTPSLLLRRSLLRLQGRRQRKNQRKSRRPSPWVRARVSRALPRGQVFPSTRCTLPSSDCRPVAWTLQRCCGWAAVLSRTACPAAMICAVGAARGRRVPHAQLRRRGKRRPSPAAITCRMDVHTRAQCARDMNRIYGHGCARVLPCGHGSRRCMTLLLDVRRCPRVRSPASAHTRRVQVATATRKDWQARCARDSQGHEQWLQPRPVVAAQAGAGEWRAQAGRRWADPHDAAREE